MGIMDRIKGRHAAALSSLGLSFAAAESAGYTEGHAAGYAAGYAAGVAAATPPTPLTVVSVTQAGANRVHVAFSAAVLAANFPSIGGGAPSFYVNGGAYDDTNPSSVAQVNATTLEFYSDGWDSDMTGERWRIDPDLYSLAGLGGAYSGTVVAS